MKSFVREALHGQRPLTQVRAAGFHIEQAQRFKLGLVERLTPRKLNTP
jgi:hypothetical protein